MIRTPRTARNLWLGLLLPFAVSFTGCGPSRQELMARDHLAKVQETYDIAKSNPCVEIKAPIPLLEALRAVEAAEKTTDFKEMDHLAYLAEKKTRIAVAIMKKQLAETDKQDVRGIAAVFRVQVIENEPRQLREASEPRTVAR